MLPRIRMDVMAATFLATLVLEVAASPSPYAGFAVDDVRRPIYRGSTRYKRYSLVNLVKTDSATNMFINHSVPTHTNHILKASDDNMTLYNVIVKRDGVVSNPRPNEITATADHEILNSDHEIENTDQEIQNSDRIIQNSDEMKKSSVTASRDTLILDDSLEDVKWQFVPLATSLSETDGTLVNNFFQNSVRILKSHGTEKIVQKINLLEPAKSKDGSLDQLILSHTDGKLPIQMYPEHKPQDWHGTPKDPNVIVIEDVHPSKLPKPDSHWSEHKPLYNQQHPSRPPSNYYAPQNSWPPSNHYTPQNSRPPSNHYTPENSRPPTNYYTPQNSYNVVNQPSKPDSWGTQRPKPQNPNSSPVILVENVAPSSTSPGHWGQYQPGPIHKPDVWTKPPTTLKPYAPIFAVGNGGPTTSHRPQIQTGNYPSGQISVQIVTTATRPTVAVLQTTRPTTTRPTTTRPIVAVQHPHYPTQPTSQNHNSIVYKPVTLKPKPSNHKPTRPTLVSNVADNHVVLPTVELPTKPTVKPQHSNAKPITVKPAFLHPKPQKPIKNPNKPVVIPSNVPEYYGILGVNQDTATGYINSTYNHNHISTPTPPTLQATLIVQNNWPSLRPVDTFPPSTQKPVHSRPIYVTHNKPLIPESGPSHIGHKPVYLYPRPIPEPPPKPLVPIHPPLNESPRPPEAPFRDPPIKPNHPLGSAVIISQTTSLPPITPHPPIRPPPPTIVILESDPPPIIEDCGTIQIINKEVKSEKSCSDVMILLNSPLAVSNGASAAASGSSGIAAAGGASVAAGAAAAGAAGAGASLAAGAAGATLAAGTAGIAALGGATAANSIVSTGNQGLTGTNSAGNRPQAIAPATPLVPSPALHPVDDESSSEEDYDYTDDSRPPSQSSTAKPPTKPSSSTTTLMDFIPSLGSALPFVMGPFSISVWIVMMGPLIFLVIGAFAVGSLIIPWFLPRILLGRRRRRRSLIPNGTVKIPESAYLFLKNLDSGHFSIYE